MKRINLQLDGLRLEYGEVIGTYDTIHIVVEMSDEDYEKFSALHEKTTEFTIYA